MKKTSPMKRATVCLAAIALLGASFATSASAAALNAQLVPRPLTPQEIKDYSLGSAPKSAGLTTVPIGQPVYLDALINNAVPSTDIPVVTWTMTNTPTLAVAALTNSPLGTNVPTFKIADRPGPTSTGLRVADRRMLTPDVEGSYKIDVSITTTTSGSTNLTLMLTAATYRGIDNCMLCHTATPGVPAKYYEWLGTKHAHAFEEAIDGKSTDHFNKNCISCHAVGFDGNTNSNNGGFDDIASQTGWVFPTTLTNGNWDAMPDSLKNVANIQCENCHGPGSQHIFGSPILGNPNLISVTMASGDCSQCHDSLTHHYKTQEWNNSRHAGGVEESRADCSRCHTAQGFANFVDGKPAVDVPYEVVTCSACHDPHDATNPHQLRSVADVELMDNTTVVTEGGAGKLCMQCHISRRDAVNYVETTAGNNRFGPHHGPQTDMLVGANAVNYGQDIPSSAHRDVVEDSCVTCHMQENEGTSSFTHAGGHTFGMKWDSGTNVVELTEACVQCHGEVEGFDFKRQDYDGNGIVEGVQTEVKGLMAKLAMMLPPYGSPVIPTDTPTISKYTRPELRALYNYLFVMEDGSYGVHNLSYAVGVLKASIADLSGDANNDGLADWWQIQYFGSANNPSAAPNATPAGDGVPNWLKYSLGLDPTVPGVVLPDGVVWANASAIGGTNNTVHIYTAAEIAFDTEVGKNYQIQAVSTLGGGWQNIGSPLAGTGQSISYVTPTRSQAQQFFRVQQLP